MFAAILLLAAPLFAGTVDCENAEARNKALTLPPFASGAERAAYAQAWLEAWPIEAGEHAIPLERLESELVYMRDALEYAMVMIEAEKGVYDELRRALLRRVVPPYTVDQVTRMSENSPGSALKLYGDTLIRSSREAAAKRTEDQRAAVAVLAGPVSLRVCRALFP